MTTKSEKQYFNTHDLALAAVLALSFPVEDINKDQPRAEFIFQVSKELQQVLTDYWRGEYKVEPQAYFNKLRTLKSRLYE